MAEDEPADGDARRPDEDEEERRRREEEEAMDRIFAAQLAEEEGDNRNDDNNNVEPGNGFLDNQPHQGPMNLVADDPQQQQQQQQQPHAPRQSWRRKVGYVRWSLWLAVAVVLHALRTRKQLYLAFLYLSSSKAAFLVFGNALVAVAWWAFGACSSIFFQAGLRPVEVETISDRVRWNVTETCLALTMFRSELSSGNLKIPTLFLALVVAKCLHWGCELRESHMRTTEEAFVTTHNSMFPRMRTSHLRFITLVHVLLIADIWAVAFCASHIVTKGPSVFILFGFESAILAISALSTLVSYQLHAVDGLITIFHQKAYPHLHDDEDDSSPTAAAAATTTPEGEETPAAVPQQVTKYQKWVDQLLHGWREHRATLNFLLELLAQSATFLFYVLFFAIVFTYYGMPINIFREVYVSFQQLRTRLAAFYAYRELTFNLNNEKDDRFVTVTSEEVLEQAGRTCIICRDIMMCGKNCKQLPGCGHVFHKACLREWLVQQQSCPTCRADITASAKRAKLKRDATQAALEREQQQQQQQQQQQTDEQGGDKEETKTQETITTKVTKEGNEGTQEPMTKTRDEPFLTPRRVAVHQSEANEEEFPGLYRVVRDGGAPVLATTTTNDTVPSLADPKEGVVVVRTVSSGRVILCTGISGEFLKMPDGWVRASHVQRMASLTPKKKRDNVPTFPSPTSLDAAVHVSTTGK
eukprot:scaffold54386_cov46-Attheya_sp.AAC.6